MDIDHPVNPDGTRFYNLLKHQIQHGKYKDMSVSWVLKNDLDYFEELLRLGIYTPIAGWARSEIQKAREKREWELRNLSILDDECYYQNEEHA